MNPVSIYLIYEIVYIPLYETVKNTNDPQPVLLQQPMSEYKCRNYSVSAVII